MKRKRALVLGIAAVVALATIAAPDAEARGRHGGRRGPVVVVRGFYGYPGYYGFGYGFGFHPFYNPWFGPYPYAPYAMGVDLNAASIAGVGAVDLNVKPGEAEVWVDGKFIDEAKELDGSPRYLWLKDGAHRIVIYRGGYVSFDERVEVRAGTAKELKVRLEKGPSEPPAGRPTQGENLQQSEGIR